MSFLLDSLDELGLEPRTMNQQQREQVFLHSVRKLNLKIIKSLAEGRDGETLASLYGGSVRLCCCSELRRYMWFREKDLRGMLANLAGQLQPHYETDTFQVGCIHYYHFACYWHINYFRYGRQISARKLPALDCQGLEFGVFLKVEPVSLRSY
ncbi:hypothetical protein [Agarivorans gilvus]|uniref:Uncharacterized protein n=1 Tax=Agarivorans gilvus TaxID=680279 RepID=A0ABQ1I1W8_9ALTE|nr:hypothetical protein [Agarivorans gilvus]GGB05442.1 hypothetical protein GCM10007414_18470 [Agarivorans gilvus]